MCMICHSNEDTEHINLYVTGSEGLNVCHGCKMQIITYIRGLMNVAGKSRMQVYKHKES